MSFFIFKILLNKTSKSYLLLSPVHTGDKVSLNKDDFDESRPCCFGPVHTDDKVERTFDIRATKSTVLATQSTEFATVSNSSCCRFVTKTSDKVDGISNKVKLIGDRRLCCQFVASFGNSRLLPVCTGL